jgi:membrane protein
MQAGVFHGLRCLRDDGVTAVRLFLRNGLQNHAAATALYFLLSAAPLSILLAWAVQAAVAWAPTPFSAAWVLKAFYQQFNLDALVQMGVIPKRHHFSASGVGLLTLLLASHGLLSSVQRAMAVIFVCEQRRGTVLSWFIPWLVVPLAIMALVLVLLSDQVLAFLLEIAVLPAGKRTLADGMNSALWVFVLYSAVYAAFYRLPVRRPPQRPTAVFAALTVLSLIGLFYGLGRVFKASEFQQIYGALGGVIFIVVAVYLAAMLFYFWAQFLRVYLQRSPCALADGGE